MVHKSGHLVRWPVAVIRCSLDLIVRRRFEPPHKHHRDRGNELIAGTSMTVQTIMQWQIAATADQHTATNPFKIQFVNFCYLLVRPTKDQLITIHAQQFIIRL